MSDDTQAWTHPATIQNMSDTEVVSLMRDGSLLSEVRRLFYHGMAEIEQAEAQRTPLSIIERRKREFIIAQRIIKAVRDVDSCGAKACGESP